MNAYTQYKAQREGVESLNGLPRFLRENDMHGLANIVLEFLDTLRAKAERDAEVLSSLKELVAALDERDYRVMALTRCRQVIAAVERREGA